MKIENNSFEPVLIKRYDGRIDSEVAAIRNNHQTNAENLNKLKQDFTEYEGTSFSIVSFLTFLKHENQKGFLIDRFVKNKKLEGLPIKPEKLEEFLEIPPYEHLLEQASYFKDWNNEKIRTYYDVKNKIFVPLPVTKEEKEQIISRNSIYANSEYELNYYNNLKGFVEIMNDLIKSHKIGVHSEIHRLPIALGNKVKREYVKGWMDKDVYGFVINYEVLAQQMM